MTEDHRGLWVVYSKVRSSSFAFLSWAIVRPILCALSAWSLWVNVLSPITVWFLGKVSFLCCLWFHTNIMSFIALDRLVFWCFELVLYVEWELYVFSYFSDWWAHCLSSAMWIGSTPIILVGIGFPLFHLYLPSSYKTCSWIAFFPCFQLGICFEPLLIGTYTYAH